MSYLFLVNLHHLQKMWCIREWAGEGAPHQWRVDVPGGTLSVRMFPTEEGEHVARTVPRASSARLHRQGRARGVSRPGSWCAGPAAQGSATGVVGGVP